MTERLTKDNDNFDWETANFMLGRIEAIVYQCAKKNKSHSKGIIEIGAIFQENDPDWFEKLDNLWEDEESGNQSSATEKQPFIPPKNWGGKKEKMREQESNLPKDEDSWEMNE